MEYIQKKWRKPKEFQQFDGYVRPRPFIELSYNPVPENDTFFGYVRIGVAAHFRHQDKITVPYFHLELKFPGAEETGDYTFEYHELMKKMAERFVQRKQKGK